MNLNSIYSALAQIQDPSAQTAVRLIAEAIASLSGQTDAATKAANRPLPPLTKVQLGEIKLQLQAGGQTPLILTGLTGASATVITGTHATRSSLSAASQNLGAQFIETDRFYLYTVETVSGSPAWRYTAGISFDLHANRWADLGTSDAGALFFELNRQYLYYWNGTAWHWMSGVYQDTLANRPADLGANDQSAIFYASDKYTVYEWTGAAWVTVGGALWQATADSTTAAQWLQTTGGGGAVVLNLDTTNKRVGINNTAPGVDLDVTGIAKASTKVITPIIQPAADSTTAIRLETTGGGAVLTVDTTNSRVGIGVTPAATSDILGNLKRKAAADSVNWAQWISAGANVILNIDSVNWRLGINNAAPSYDLDVGTDINAGGTYRKGGTDIFAGVTGAHTITLAKITAGGANGSITWNAFGIVTGWVDPT